MIAYPSHHDDSQSLVATLPGSHCAWHHRVTDSSSLLSHGACQGGGRGHSGITESSSLLSHGLDDGGTPRGRARSLSGPVSAGTVMAGLGALTAAASVPATNLNLSPDSDSAPVTVTIITIMTSKLKGNCSRLFPTVTHFNRLRRTAQSL